MACLGPATKEIPCRSGAAILAFLAVVLAVISCLGYEVVRVGLLSYLEESWDVVRLRQAMRWDPDNPAVARRLGLAYTYSIVLPDPTNGLGYLCRAAELSRHPLYWASYGEACDAGGKPECGTKALQEAVRLAPTTPRYRWLLANHYLRSGQAEEALGEFRSLLRLDDLENKGYARATFSVCLKALDDPEKIFRRILTEAASERLKLAYLQYLSDTGRSEAADRIWRKTAAGPERLDFPLAVPYLKRLFARQRYRAAKIVWSDLLRSGAIKEPASKDRDNLIFNGGFEQPSVGPGFDWGLGAASYVSVDFTDPRSYKGLHCLRIDFTVPRNEEYQPVYIFAPVEPGRTYRLRFYARSEEIQSDSGPRLRVVDPDCPSCVEASSKMTTGTTAWHPVDLIFSTGPQTEVIEIFVWRPRSRAFPADVSGSFWLDAVSLHNVKAS